MRFSEAVRTCLRKYATFSGRATRPEYWYFILFLILGGIVLNFVDYQVFGGEMVATDSGFEMRTNGPLASLFSLATFLPALAAGWRRMHDTGRSGLFLLYPLIAMMGVSIFIAFVAGFETILSGGMGAAFGAVTGIVAAVAVFVLAISPLLVLWWLTRPSQPGENEFGPSPA